MSDMTKAHCNRCRGETNQDVLASDEIAGEGDKREYGNLTRFEMLKCRGCNSTSMLQKTYLSEHADDFYVVQYPPAIARRTPEWVNYPPDNIPGEIIDLLYEAYTAAQNHLVRIAAMGIRAALERVMVDKVGDQGTFVRNVDAFVAAGYLSYRQRQVFDEILAAGHASTHRGWEPTNDDIDSLLDIAESVTESVYLHEGRARNLAKTVPRREPRQNR